MKQISCSSPTAMALVPLDTAHRMVQRAVQNVKLDLALVLMGVSAGAALAAAGLLLAEGFVGLSGIAIFVAAVFIVAVMWCNEHQITTNFVDVTAHELERMSALVKDCVFEATADAIVFAEIGSRRPSEAVPEDSKTLPCRPV